MGQVVLDLWARSVLLGSKPARRVAALRHHYHVDLCAYVPMLVCVVKLWRQKGTQTTSEDQGKERRHASRESDDKVSRQIRFDTQNASG